MKPFTLNIKGRIVRFDRPAVMGIINATPDSFYAPSRVAEANAIAERARQMVADGVDIIDIGACSTRPGAQIPTAEQETIRFEEAVRAVRAAIGPDLPISVDTFRADIAREAITSWGADIINDISGGTLDPDMLRTVGQLNAPYILMHTRGTPAEMQQLTDYTDVTAEVLRSLTHTLAELESLGVADVIIDPGFGFAKTLEQNYTLLAQLEAFTMLERPILVGLSRKSMATKLLGISADEALSATCVLNALALERGAAILRVHDVAQARQTITLCSRLSQNS